MPGDVARDDRLEDVRVSDLPHAAHGLLPLQAVDRRLDRRVGGAWRRKRLLDFADGGLPVGPKGFEDLQLELAELRPTHVTSPISYLILLFCSRLRKAACPPRTSRTLQK